MSKYMKYPSYKDSGVEWIGTTPEYWKNYRIDWVSTIVRGNTGFKRDELLAKGEYVALQYGKTYKVDEVNETFHFYVNDEFYKLSQIVHRGDTILISTSETVKDLGHSCFYNRDELGLVGGEQILLKPNNHLIFKKYLYYSSKVFCSVLKKYASGLKVFRFNIDDLKNIFIAIPPIQEQQTIANYLDIATDKIDTLISKQTKLIELLREKRQAVISTAVTRGLDSTVAMKDSGVEWLGEIPEHWEAKPVQFIAKITRGAILRPVDAPEYFDDNGEWAYLNISDATKCDKYLTTSKLRLSKLGSTKSARVYPDNVIITASATIGKAFINKIKVCIHDGFIPFTDIKIYKDYLYHYLSNPFLYAAMGKSNTQKNIYLDEVKRMIITVPPMQEQIEIVNYLESKSIQMNNLIEKAEKAVNLLKEKRTALISAAVTGKIDVREIV